MYDYKGALIFFFHINIQYSIFHILIEIREIEMRKVMYYFPDSVCF